MMTKIHKVLKLTNIDEDNENGFMMTKIHKVLKQRIML